MLVALDGSRLAEQVLPVASTLARSCAGELVLLHVVEPEAPARIHGEPHLGDAASAERYLADVAAALTSVGVHTRVAVVPATDGVAETIARCCDELQASLIALTTHGQGGLRGLLFGRIAQQVLQLAERPTLVVRSRAGEHLPTRQPVPLHRLLVPLAGPSERDAALPLASRLAQCLQAELVLARIVPSPERLSVAESAPSVFLPTATAALLALERERAEEELRAVAATLPAGTPITIQVTQGDVVEELAALAATCHLVVLATHGRAGLPGWLAGSVAARLLERTPTPLLLVPYQRSTPY